MHLEIRIDHAIGIGLTHTAGRRGMRAVRIETARLDAVIGAAGGLENSDEGLQVFIARREIDLVDADFDFGGVQAVPRPCLAQTNAIFRFFELLHLAADIERLGEMGLGHLIVNFQSRSLEKTIDGMQAFARDVM